MPRMNPNEIARFATSEEKGGKQKLKQVRVADHLDGRDKDRQRQQRRNRAAEKRGE